MSRVQTQASEIQHLELLPGAGRVARGRTKQALKAKVNKLILNLPGDKC